MTFRLAKSDKPYRCTARAQGAYDVTREVSDVISQTRKRAGKNAGVAVLETSSPSANILTLRTLSLLFPARTIFSKESPQYAAVSSKYFMPYMRI